MVNKLSRIGILNYFNKYICGIIVVVLACITIGQREIDNQWDRPINADGKGYYAYLPAAFIYQDFTYSFVDDMERKYYPADGSHAKAFRMEQPNGTVVNKCFPGTAVFYLPFFLIAVVISWIAGLPVDGYSIVFQWAIPVAQFFYFFLALFVLKKVFKQIGVRDWLSSVALILIVFASNVYFYLVYDFTVTHVFGFFGASTVIFWTYKFKSKSALKYIGYACAMLALLVIMRPTNALLVLVFPLVLNAGELKSLFKVSNWFKQGNFYWILFAVLIVCLAPVMWKVQSGNWFVYSYGNEKIDLTQPHFWQFLFSYTKGWWLWTPFMFVAFCAGTAYFWLQSKWQGCVFFVGILGVVYIFSSWWIWTFGMGFGQRPMIDFYPLLIVGFAGFFQWFQHKWTLVFIAPFVLLNVIQADQIHRFILVGGATTKEDYWNHFLQLQVDPPSVKIEENWKEMQRVKKTGLQVLDEKAPFSQEIRLKMLKKGSKVVVKAKIGGKKDKTKATLVLSNESGEFYRAHYIQKELNESLRTMSFLFEIEQTVEAPIKCYIWNGDSKEHVQLESLEVIQYIPVKQ